MYMPIVDVHACDIFGERRDRRDGKKDGEVGQNVGVTAECRSHR